MTNAEAILRCVGVFMKNTRPFISAILLRGSAIFCSLLITVVLTRALDMDAYGSYIFALSVLTILAIPIQSGLPELVVREVSFADTSGDHGLVKGVLTRALQFSLLLPLIIMVAWLVLTMSLPQVFDGLVETRLISIAILALPALALLAVIGAALRAFQRFFTGQLLGLLMSRLLNLVLLAGFLAFFAFDGLSPETALGIYVAACMLTLGVAATLLYRHEGYDWRQISRRYETRKWAASIGPLSLIAGLTIIVSKTDIVMLRLLRGPTDVAVYHVASQFGNLVLIAKAGVLTVMGPRISRLYQQKDMPLMQSEVSQAARFVFLSGLPIALILVLFGQPLLITAFGAEFGQAYTTMLIIAAGHLALSLFGSIDTLLKMTNQEGLVLKFIGLAVVLNILFNALLIPHYGTEGAALATAVSVLAWRCVLVFEAYRRLGVVSFAVGPRL